MTDSSNAELIVRLRWQATGDVQPEHTMMIEAANALAAADARIAELEDELGELDYIRGAAEDRNTLD